MLRRFVISAILMISSFSAYAVSINISQCSQAEQQAGQTGLVTAITAIEAGCNAANFISNMFGSTFDPKVLALSAGIKIACTSAETLASGVCEYCSKNTTNCIKCGNYMRGNYGGDNFDARFKTCFNTWTGVLGAAVN